MGRRVGERGELLEVAFRVRSIRNWDSRAEVREMRRFEEGYSAAEREVGFEVE